MANNDDDLIVGQNEEIWQQTLRHVQTHTMKMYQRSTKKVQQSKLI